MEGISMSQFVLREVKKSLARPSREELLKAIRQQSEVVLDQSPADVLREERGSR